VVDAVAEGGDQPEPRAGRLDHGGGDPVGHGRHEHVGPRHGLEELALAEGPVLAVQPRIEELAQPGLDAVRELAGDDDQRGLAGHGSRLGKGPATGSKRVLPL